MKRGEVWIANLNPNRGAEVGKIRPVLIMQDDALTEAGLPTVVVLPLTTRVRPRMKHLRLTLDLRGRLQETCQVMVDQPRTVDRARISEGPLTSLTPEEITAVERSLLGVLGIPGGLQPAGGI